MDDRIKTLHPEGKSGVSISKEKYRQVSEAILEVVGEEGEHTFKELVPAVKRTLQDGFEGSISWYVTTVKLDLEARGLLERIPKSRPQRIRLRGRIPPRS